MSRRVRLDPNLSRAPFENARPVGRLAALLWVLAAVVGAGAFWSISQARERTSALRADLAAASAESVTLRGESLRLKTLLGEADLTALNERTEFLNARIAERAFSWTDLFDALADVLPREVRVHDLKPQGFASVRDSRSRRATGSPTSEVSLGISGESESSDALLEFVDRLFDHPAFGDPNLARESSTSGAMTKFQLTVAYRPGWRQAQAASDLSLADANDAGASAGPPGAVSGSASANSGVAEATPTVAATGQRPGVPSTVPPAAAAPGLGPARSRPVDPTSARSAPTAPSNADVRSAWGESVDEAVPSSAGSRGSARETPPALGPASAPPMGVPVLPAPLKPFASGPARVR